MTAAIPLPNHWVCLYPQNDRAATEASAIVAVSPDNRGLAYADGFFTTMGVIDGQILWDDYHYQRLVSHADALQFDIDASEIIAVLKLYAEQLEQGMLKLIVTRAAQDIRGYGYTPSESGSACEVWLKPSVMRVSTALQLTLPDGALVPMQPVAAAICLSSQIACLPPTLAGLKTLSRLDNVLASGELQQIKAEPLASAIAKTLSEGLLRDMSGDWVEGTMSNVFYQLADEPRSESIRVSSSHEANENYLTTLTTGQWYTPSMTQSGVAGVMRQVIIDALTKTECAVEIRPLTDEDLPRLTQLFFCNALRGIIPMSSLTLLSGEVVNF